MIIGKRTESYSWINSFEIIWYRVVLISNFGGLENNMKFGK